MTEVTDPVGTIYNDVKSMLAFLLAQGQPSFQTFADAHLRKALLLAAASAFENRLCNIIREFTATKSGSCESLASFVDNVGINRKYHTYFNWDENNANQFFGLFGANFKSRVKKKVDEDTVLRGAMRDFLALGQLRNRLVHQNFASFSIDLTTGDIYEKYQSASAFVEFIRQELGAI